MQAEEVSAETLARRYVWWESPEHALGQLDHLLCQLMQLGTYEDVRAARQLWGDDAFRRALKSARPGILDAKSWNFWHRYFGILPVPPMPRRPLP